MMGQRNPTQVSASGMEAFSSILLKSQGQQSVEEKTAALLHFINNRHALSVVYDVMSRFQRAEKRMAERPDLSGHLSKEFAEELL